MIYISVSIGVDKPTLTVRSVVLPVTLIDRSVRPNLLSSAASFALQPLTDVDCTSAVIKLLKLLNSLSLHMDPETHFLKIICPARGCI